MSWNIFRVEDDEAVLYSALAPDEKAAEEEVRLFSDVEGPFAIWEYTEPRFVLTCVDFSLEEVTEDAENPPSAVIEMRDGFAVVDASTREWCEWAEHTGRSAILLSCSEF